MRLAAIFLLLSNAVASQADKIPDKKSQQNIDGEQYVNLLKASIVDGNLFLLLQKTTVIDHPERFNFFQPHNSHTEYVKDITYLQVKANSFGTKIAVDLSKGILKRGLIYVDSDFTVVKKNEIVSVSNIDKTISTKCDQKFWGGTYPLRVGDRLFYCGIYFEKSGEKYTRFTKQLESQILKFSDPENISQQFVKQNQEGYHPVFSVIRNGRYLNIAVNRLKRGNTFKASIEYLVVDTESDKIIGSKKLPFDENEYQLIHDVRFFSDDSFVLLSPKRNEKNFSIYICNGELCRSIDPRFAKLSGSLVIDNASNLGVYVDKTYPSNIVGQYDVTFIGDLFGATSIAY